MKLSAIKRVCMDAKQFCIYDEEDGTQWIGTQDAAYPVGGELFSEANIAEIFDLTPKQEEKVEVRRMDWETSDLICREDIVGVGMAKMAQGLQVYYVGTMMQTLAYRGRLYLVRAMDIKAAGVSDRGYLDYYMDEDDAGNPLVVISDGMIVAGVVRPLDREISKGMLGWMREYGQMIPGGKEVETFGAKDGGENRVDGQIGMEAALEEDCAEWADELSEVDEQDDE